MHVTSFANRRFGTVCPVVLALPVMSIVMAAFEQASHCRPEAFSEPALRRL